MWSYIHSLLHRHIGMTHAQEEIVICGPRWWWSRLGNIWVYYRPHRHAPWQRLTPDEFKNRFPKMKNVT